MYVKSVTKTWLGAGLEFLLKNILANRQGIVGVRCRLVFFQILAKNTVLLPDTPYPVHIDLNAMRGKIAL